MLHPIKKIIAIFLAIWLPLFSGSALAGSLSVQGMGDSCCPVSAQQDGHHARHAQMAAPQDQPAKCDLSAKYHEQQNGSQNHQNSPCDDCGVCHLAYSGYLATAAIKAPEFQPLIRLFTAFSTQFKSATPTPLDPPPLARA